MTARTLSLRKLAVAAGIGLTLATATRSHAQPPIDVRIEHFTFTPEVVTIRVGRTVRWTNFDSIEHTATSQTGPGTLIPSGAFDSDLQSLGGVYLFTFSTPGTYHYYCLPHGSSMQGTIIVEAAPPCPADFNGDGGLDPDDLGDFINCYFAVQTCEEADFNVDSSVDPDDLGDFINAYFAGC